MQIAQPAFAPALPVRAWRVDLDPSRTRWSCAAPGCLGTELKRRRAPQVALGHLAEHAAAEPLPGHLRTCRCQSRGCVWHPRHRGCDGPVSLVVFRSRGGATWQLADACTACARSIPHAAQLPPPPQLANDPRRTHARQTCTSDATAVNGLDPLLTYLDAALAPGTEPVVRLFALLCLLRADRAGEVCLPYGLLRGCRLAHRAQECKAELVRQSWLCEPHGAGAGTAAAPSAQISDSTATAALRTTTRRHRGQLLDQAIRLLSHPDTTASPHAAYALALPASAPTPGLQRRPRNPVDPRCGRRT